MKTRTHKFYICAIDKNGEYEYVYDCQNVSNQEIYDILESLIKKYVRKMDNKTDVNMEL